MPPENRSIDKEGVKALVMVYGPKETARITGLPIGTIQGWCFRYKWKRHNLKFKNQVGLRVRNDTPASGKSPSELLAMAMDKHRDESTLNLAEYTQKASKAAAKHDKPLEIARSVKDVAGVYSTLWPPEEQSELIAGAILTGQAQVVDDPEEILLMAKEADVRKEIPGSGSAGH